MSASAGPAWEVLARMRERQQAQTQELLMRQRAQLAAVQNALPATTTSTADVLLGDGIDPSTPLRSLASSQRITATAHAITPVSSLLDPAVGCVVDDDDVIHFTTQLA